MTGLLGCTAEPHSQVRAPGLVVKDRIRREQPGMAGSTTAVGTWEPSRVRRWQGTQAVNEVGEVKEVKVEIFKDGTDGNKWRMH